MLNYISSSTLTFWRTLLDFIARSSVFGLRTLLFDFRTLRVCTSRLSVFLRGLSRSVRATAPLGSVVEGWRLLTSGESELAGCILSINNWYHGLIRITEQMRSFVCFKFYSTDNEDFGSFCLALARLKLCSLSPSFLLSINLRPTSCRLKKKTIKFIFQTGSQAECFPPS